MPPANEPASDWTVDGLPRRDTDMKTEKDTRHLLPIDEQRDPDQPASGLRHDGQDVALTAKEMNATYKETSEGGLAVSLVLC